MDQSVSHAWELMQQATLDAIEPDLGYITVEVGMDGDQMLPEVQAEGVPADSVEVEEVHSEVHTEEYEVPTDGNNNTSSKFGQDSVTLSMHCHI